MTSRNITKTLETNKQTKQATHLGQQEVGAIEQRRPRGEEVA